MNRLRMAFGMKYSHNNKDKGISTHNDLVKTLM